MGACLQAFDKNVPKEIASVGIGIESNDLRWLRAICSIIKQKINPVRTPAEDRKIDALRRPTCPGRESRTGPCGICFQDAIVCKRMAAMTESISFLGKILILFIFIHIELETSKSV
jgi:hypothetical protein